MAVEEAKLQLLLLRDPLQEVVEAKCLHQEVQLTLELLLHLEVTLEVGIHQEELVQDDSSKHLNTKALKKISAFFSSNW